MYFQDWANPLVRPHICLHIEISDCLSEFYQGEQLQKKADLDSLQLMSADFKEAPHHHFYIKKVVQLTDYSYMIPMKWVSVFDHDGRETECADVHNVTIDSLVHSLTDLQIENNINK